MLLASLNYPDLFQASFGSFGSKNCFAINLISALSFACRRVLIINEIFRLLYDVKPVKAFK